MSVHCLIVTKNRPISCWVFNLSHSEIRQQTTPTTVSTRESTKLWGHEDTHKHDLHIYTYIALAASYVVLSCIHFANFARCKIWILFHFSIMPNAWTRHLVSRRQGRQVSTGVKFQLLKFNTRQRSADSAVHIHSHFRLYEIWTNSSLYIPWNVKVYALSKSLCINKKDFASKSLSIKKTISKKNCICPACQILHSICCRLM